MTEDALTLVSVVIPTYNHARYLGRALQSVCAQTYVNWEAIVIDNHSTDNTDEVMASFTDPRITYLKIHNNGVIAASRNAGILAAKGEWIAFLDSDDWWTEDKLQACFACINDHVDLVYHDLEIVKEPPDLGRRKYTRGRQVKAPVVKDLLLKGNTIANTSVVMRKRLLEQIHGINEDVEMIAAEDYNTWLRIAQISDNFLYIPHSFGFYLFHASGGSRKNIDVLLQNVSREFLHLLEPRERIVFAATARYIGVLNDFYSDKPCIAKRNLLYSIWHGSFLIRMKSIVLYTILSLKS